MLCSNFFSNSLIRLPKPLGGSFGGASCSSTAGERFLHQRATARPPPTAALPPRKHRIINIHIGSRGIRFSSPACELVGSEKVAERTVPDRVLGVKARSQAKVVQPLISGKLQLSFELESRQIAIFQLINFGAGAQGNFRGPDRKSTRLKLQ